MARCRANAAWPKPWLPSGLRHCRRAAPGAPAWHAPLGERRSPGQVSSMLGTVSVMHLEADDLAAVEVQDQVEVEPASLDLRRKERHVPAPNVAGTGGDVRG